MADTAKFRLKSLSSPKKVVKYLIIRFSSIGDIVLTTPVVRCLKQQVEGAEVHYVTKKQFEGILKHNPYIDKVHTYDGDLKTLMKKLKSENFDYVIDLHHNLRSAVIKERLGKISFSFDKINIKKWMMVNLKINRLPNNHIVDRYLDTLKLFDVKNDGKGLDFFIPEADRVDIGSLNEKLINGFIGWVIGAKHNTKKYPLNKIVETINNLEKPVVLLGGKDDFRVGQEISDHLPEKVVNSCGKFNLNQSASLVQQAKLIVSNDTGLMHIAAAFHKPIFSLWGNTIPEFGMYPYQPAKDSRIFEVNGLKCRPCSKIGHDECPKKHFKCMNEIKPEELSHSITAFFDSNP